MIKNFKPSINFAGLQSTARDQFTGLDPNDPPSWPALPRYVLCAFVTLFVVIMLWLFRPGQVSVKDYYAELPIAVRVTGKYHDLGAFAADIANLSRIVTLSNLTITPGKDGNLVMDTTAKTFRYLDGDEVALQRKSAPANGAKK